jgi:hypothetical protein
MAVVLLMDVASCCQVVGLSNQHLLLPFESSEIPKFIDHLLRKNCFWVADRVLQAVFRLRSSKDPILPLWDQLKWFFVPDVDFGISEQELWAKVYIMQTFYEGRALEVGHARTLNFLEYSIDTLRKRDADDTADWVGSRSYIRQRLISFDRDEERYSPAAWEKQSLGNLLGLANRNGDLTMAREIQSRVHESPKVLETLGDPRGRATRIIIHNKTQVKLHVRSSAGCTRNSLEPGTIGVLACKPGVHRLEIAFGTLYNYFRPDPKSFTSDIPEGNVPEASWLGWAAAGAGLVSWPPTGASLLYTIPILGLARRAYSAYRDSQPFSSDTTWTGYDGLLLTSEPCPVSSLTPMVKQQMFAMEAARTGDGDGIVCQEDVKLLSNQHTCLEIHGGPWVEQSASISRSRVIHGGSSGEPRMRVPVRKLVVLKFSETKAIHVELRN